MAVIDNDSNGTPDGIINLYDEYNAISGTAPITIANGVWFDPNFNFALDSFTGNLFLWDLNVSSDTINTHTFQLINLNSGCPGGLVVQLNVILGPFEGKPLPPVGPNDANVSICETNLSSFDLFQVFESQPSPHQNGVWNYVGNLGDPNNFKGLSPDGKFDAEIPYEPGGDLIEFDVFEFTYTVPGISPCATSTTSNFKVEVIRDVQSGEPSQIDICESDILAGLWDNDINLRDDTYLVDEDIEGTWSSMEDPTLQISNPLDSIINIREVFDFLKTSNPKYGCREFTYKYTVNARSALSDCSDKESDIIFRIYEPVKPFQQDTPVAICIDGAQSGTVSLYDELNFTTENGELYDYPESLACTSWSFVSGPRDIRVSASSGNIDIAQLTRADDGTYVFRYDVSNSCNSCPSGGNFACLGQSAEVIVNVNASLYAGENTLGLDFCETDPIIAAPLDLFSLLTTNGIDDPIYQGAMGTWANLDNGTLVTNPITLPEVNGQQTFNFLYSTLNAEGCFDRASLSFTVYESYQAGVSSFIDICNTSPSIDLFDILTGDPNTNGTWSGPNGYSTLGHNAIFDPSVAEAGVYTYTVPDNVSGNNTIICSGGASTVTVTLHQSPNAGADMSGTACQSDGQINLVDYLDTTADTGGDFMDIDATGVLSESILDVSQLNMGTYNFQYQIQGHNSCTLSVALIAITVEEVGLPNVENQTFCVSDGPTVTDLQVDNGDSFNWYDTLDATSPLPLTTALVNTKAYYVSAVDSNGCESSRVPTTVTLLPFGHVDCDDCIKDGISVNGDNINDEFDLCGLPTTFPNFEIEIYNRYGTVVYKGNQNTPLFKGVSNVALTLGKELPSGVFFYVFDPKDGINAPFQGNFYLSR